MLSEQVTILLKERKSVMGAERGAPKYIRHIRRISRYLKTYEAKTPEFLPFSESLEPLMKFMKNQDKTLSNNTTLDDNESILSQVQKPNNWINDYVKNLKNARRKN